MCCRGEPPPEAGRHVFAQNIMSSRKRTSSSRERSSGHSREVVALFSLAVGVFYYLCIFTYTPLDPSFFAQAAHVNIANLGGIVGAYLAGLFFFLVGGASYFFGLYFVINAVLLVSRQRSKLKFLDFFVFVVCTVFVAIFLQLQFVTIAFGDFSINAGGVVGKILGLIGGRYLGRWGVYLIVVFGTLTTFILATRLSLVEALNSSTVVIGKGMGSLGGQLLMYLVRLQKHIQKKLAERAQRRKQILQKKTLPATSPMIAGQPTTLTNSDKKKIEDLMQQERPGEPRINDRKDAKPTKRTLQQMEIKTEGYQFPPLALLDHEEAVPVVIDEESLKLNAKILESKLKDFEIDGAVTEIHPGPVITMYEFQPAPGVKLSRISNLTDDLSLAMGGRSVRVVAPLPNKPAIGIEIPNHTRETVWLKDIICDERFHRNESRLFLALGKDTEGNPYLTDLQKMPHVLVAGSTGSGKSVSINTMICSILYKARPDEVRMIMIDPKMIELSLYEDIPHLLLPVVTEPKKACLALKWAVREMERRYLLLADVNARNLAIYNKKIEAGDYQNKERDPESTAEPLVHEGKLPYVVIIIDEFADLMMVTPKEIEESVCRLAQKARAAGIHVVLATQRPSVDVITGLIKANFPSRISFRVTSRHDARTILDHIGAEQLLGLGDMLFMPPNSSRVTRLHGAYVSEKEIGRIVKHVKEQAEPAYQEDILDQPEAGEDFEGMDGEGFDEYYDQAVQIVSETRRVSISSIQRHFRIGYNRAARIVELMETQGIVSSANGQGQRDVLVGGH